MVMLNSSFAAWISRLFACMGGCFGCCTKPTPIIAVDEPSKGLRIQGRVVKKRSISDGFWSTSTCDLDNSTIQSQPSISSISTSNLTLTHSNVGGSVSNPPEFVFFSGIRTGCNGLVVVVAATQRIKLNKNGRRKSGNGEVSCGSMGTGGPI
ncbi:hypothetical protein SDJN02_15509 [Cucurbita argyrosperma subsp. argyrosperma]|nr:hypothetical protein SDJN02_15509 [Cucurbita argyrosperma subsp. argyrosperma]